MPARDVPFTACRTLLVDADIHRGPQLVQQLIHAGFETDLAVNWQVAHEALQASHYHACLLATDLDQPTQLELLARLRRRAPRMWIMVLSDRVTEGASILARARGADAVMSTPFALRDLTWRLAALSVRQRPTF